MLTNVSPSGICDHVVGTAPGFVDSLGVVVRRLQAGIEYLKLERSQTTEISRAAFAVVVPLDPGDQREA